MEDTELDNLVLTYDKYNYYKERFGKIKPFSSETVTLDEIFREADVKGVTKTQYSDAFNVLLYHIHNDGVFLKGNDPDACKYINYILYDQVEYNFKQNYDEKLKSFFQKILDAYGQIRGGKYRCISNIYNMQSTTYNKIKPLYELYDKNKYCSGFSENTVQHKCEAFEEYFRLYNGYMFGTYSKSLEFNKILKNIEEHANKILSLYRKGGKCNGYSNDLQSPRLFIPPPVKERKIHNEEQIRETRLQSVDSTSHHATPGISHTPQTELTNDIQRLQPIQENQGTREGNNVHVNHSANDSLQFTSRQEAIHPFIREQEEETQVFSRFPNPFRASYHTGTSLYSGNDGHEREQAFSKEVEGPSSSVMSTITNALRDVDPVPVVGVSGGMGALFLLFRYTPVGAFFRGGRGRAHRIPRSFNGQFLGGFPGYEDYDVGHIGYGPMSMNPLAE